MRLCPRSQSLHVSTYLPLPSIVSKHAWGLQRADTPTIPPASLRSSLRKEPRRCRPQGTRNATLTEGARLVRGQRAEPGEGAHKNGALDEDGRQRRDGVRLVPIVYRLHARIVQLLRLPLVRARPLRPAASDQSMHVMMTWQVCFSSRNGPTMNTSSLCRGLAGILIFLMSRYSAMKR